VPLKGQAKIEQPRWLARASIAKWLCKQKLNCPLLSMCRERCMQRRERKSSGAAINSSHGIAINLLSGGAKKNFDCARTIQTQPAGKAFVWTQFGAMNSLDETPQSEWVWLGSLNVNVNVNATCHLHTNNNFTHLIDFQSDK